MCGRLVLFIRTSQLKVEYVLLSIVQYDNVWSVQCDNADLRGNSPTVDGLVPRNVDINLKTRFVQDLREICEN